MNMNSIFKLLTGAPMFKPELTEDNTISIATDLSYTGNSKFTLEVKKKGKKTILTDNGCMFANFSNELKKDPEIAATVKEVVAKYDLTIKKRRLEATLQTSDKGDVDFIKGYQQMLYCADAVDSI